MRNFSYVPSPASPLRTSRRGEKSVGGFTRRCNDRNVLTAPRSQVALGNALAEAVSLPIPRRETSWHEMKFRGDQETFPSTTWERGERAEKPATVIDRRYSLKNPTRASSVPLQSSVRNFSYLWRTLRRGEKSVGRFTRRRNDRNGVAFPFDSFSAISVRNPVRVRTGV